ncbi:MAG TPA: muconolactone Delta-isomerase family protein [Planctomycetota bacterium]|nr:muconolactone Delta-isomerase family protein [Planctomycetota bacterium]
MKYLVMTELAEALPHEPRELLRHVEEKVIPTHEALLELQQQGKLLAGGDMAGRRGTVCILEAESNAEVTRLLARLPLWPLHETEVIPLESFDERQAMHRQMAEALKASAR